MLNIKIKIAIRNLFKDRTNTILNIIGLTAAFGSAFLLCVYSLYELSTDEFHKNHESIYKIYTNEQTTKGPKSSDTHPIPFANALQTEVPGIEKISRYVTGGTLLTYNGNTFRVSSAWVDPPFFDMFSFPISKGNKTTPITDKNSIVLNQKMANTIFAQEMAIGKTVIIQRDGVEVPLTVSAILEEIPSATSMNFQAVYNFENLPDAYYANNLDRWDNQNHAVYTKLAPEITPEKFEASTKDFSNLHFAEVIANSKRDGAKPDANGNFRQLKLLPLKDESFVINKNGLITVDRSSQYFVLGIAFLILFIASVNFINMNLAKSMNRLREVGIRKTLGAKKMEILLQFWSESMMVYGIAFIFGGLLSYILIKPFQILFETKASFISISNPSIILGTLISILLITLIAGGYPAFTLSRLKTLHAVKGKLEANGKNIIRNVLIIVQFSIAIFLIGGTLILWQQLDYLRNKDLGFNKEQVIAFPLNTKQERKKALQLFRDEFSGNPDILSVTASDNILGLGKDGTMMTSVISFDYKNRLIATHMLSVDYDYPETLDIEFIKGRSFNRNFQSDSVAVVINEAMARELAEKNPMEAHLILGDNSTRFSIIGVVKDFNFQNVDQQIAPITFFLGDSTLRYVYVKVAPNNLLKTYEYVKETWNKMEPNTAFLGSFLDENIDRSLKRERTMMTMIGSGSILAIILSCFGLLALSLLVVSQRQKEIGIRKVIGGSLSSLVILLTKDFLQLVIVAFFIATPLAWYAAHQWLQNYAYRIDLNLWTFLVAGGIALIIAVFTIIFGTVKAALKNPVESLKME
ncbi:ABC transporter permease [Aequorivita sp. SDUM287046]|uniref:ABC transporter permease n=1 Tax=Aequorivita aurantiaca TaxID=3053356 RepID=A0ABT8DIX9_9FLAO|nr:ABC transporter permease [Aequorivita aurantiaca]MDN3725340.1 ABC transporter permease [Aequorivita aurantiaca]